MNIFHNQEWATWESKALSRLIRQMRIMRSIWILNQPDFDGLHPYVRENRVPMRIIHPHVWDEDGLTNGPPQVFWKFQWFDYKQQAITRRWSCIIDELHVQSMDAAPDWSGYEDDKVQNFKRLVEELAGRREKENQAEDRKAKKHAKNGATPSPPLLLRSRGPTHNGAASGGE